MRMKFTLIAGMLLVLSTSVVLATCYTTILKFQCGGAPQVARCTNDCVAITYDPSETELCDSHDGECGKLQCPPTTVTCIKNTYHGDKLYLPGTTNCYGCDMNPWPVFQEPVGTCIKVTLQGDKCGYCP